MTRVTCASYHKKSLLTSLGSSGLSMVCKTRVSQGTKGSNFCFLLEEGRNRWARLPCHRLCLRGTACLTEKKFIQNRSTQSCESEFSKRICASRFLGFCERNSPDTRLPRSDFGVTRCQNNMDHERRPLSPSAFVFSQAHEAVHLEP